MKIVDSPLIAHRGASAVSPENTLVAVELAAKMGARWIETDVRLTADGGLVIIHDAMLDRTTSGSGRVISTSTETICGLDAGSWFSPEFANARVPDLRSYLQCVLDCGLSLQLELKENVGREEDLVAAVIAELQTTWPLGDRGLFLSGFSERITRTCAAALPDVPRALATEFLPKDPKARLSEARCQILHVQADVTSPEDLKPYADIEIAVATINDAEMADRFLKAGVTSILSDQVDLLANSPT
ncbi:glycerophosphodiester phosphodiesterase family protein [Paracoccus sp. JM45]|uniref:glycerophosphodiester phosphodiesterase family protein n=1 Tax=Paracoccus sp. JM45 TaxID=2283626 RepID=UPI000E6BCC53|nr:glycerophosphodiester phosphodiesterase family protein [Paracoccus sp. JM45]RJE78770.1 glycerophosphoryl diester phosphodiesterase [Paracoccus sp. JM45]